MSKGNDKVALQAHRAFVRDHLPALREALDKNQTVVAISRALIKAEIPVTTELLRVALTEEIGPVG
jgi:hypothetical protein